MATASKRAEVAIFYFFFIVLFLVLLFFFGKLNNSEKATKAVKFSREPGINAEMGRRFQSATSLGFLSSPRQFVCIGTL